MLTPRERGIKVASSEISRAKRSDGERDKVVELLPLGGQSQVLASMPSGKIALIMEMQRLSTADCPGRLS